MPAPLPPTKPDEPKDEPKTTLPPKPTGPDATAPVVPEKKTTPRVETPAINSIGPQNPPSYEPAELDKALKAARESFGPSTDITPAAYESLCRLAEVLTFVKRSGAGVAPADQKQALDDLLRRATARPAQTDKIAESATALLAGADAKGGILLAGDVTGVGVQGDLHGAAVRMAGQAKPVSVLSGQSLAVKKDDKVLILGHLVRDPAKNLAGYKGPQPVVVWAILAVKLP